MRTQQVSSSIYKIWSLYVVFLGDPYPISGDITEMAFGVIPNEPLATHNLQTLVISNQASFKKTNYSHLREIILMVRY